MIKKHTFGVCCRFVFQLAFVLWEYVVMLDICNICYFFKVIFGNYKFKIKLIHSVDRFLNESLRGEKPFKRSIYQISMKILLDGGFSLFWPRRKWNRCLREKEGDRSRYHLMPWTDQITCFTSKARNILWKPCNIKNHAVSLHLR